VTQLTSYRQYGLVDLSADARANLSANIVSTLQAGCFLGAIISAYIADRWGRRPILLWAAIISIVGVALQAGAAGHLSPMYIGRFLAGVGTGSVLSLATLE
jgi:MFS family permease